MSKNKPIIGNSVGIPNPKSDWNQTDETKADFIKNKPDINGMIDDKLGKVDEALDKLHNYAQTLINGGV